MKKESFYFSHDYNARNDQKILQLRSEYGFEGYGIYWAILETMAETDDGRIIATLLGGLSVGLSLPKDRLLAIVQFCVDIDLFQREGDGIFSKRMDEHKAHRKLLSDKGKVGAGRRWPQGKNSPPNRDPNAKERKYILTEYINTSVNYFNSVTGKRYESESKETIKALTARHKEGRTIEEVKQVIESRFAKWHNDPVMGDFMRPSTVFGNKFADYLAESKPTLKAVPQTPEIDFDDYTRPYFNRTS